MTNQTQDINKMLEAEVLEAIKQQGLTRFRASEVRVNRFTTVIRAALDRLVRQGVLGTEVEELSFPRANPVKLSGKSRMAHTKKKFYIVN